MLPEFVGCLGGQLTEAALLERTLCCNSDTCGTSLISPFQQCFCELCEVVHTREKIVGSERFSFLALSRFLKQRRDTGVCWFVRFLSILLLCRLLSWCACLAKCKRFRGRPKRDCNQERLQTFRSRFWPHSTSRCAHARYPNCALSVGESGHCWRWRCLSIGQGLE